MKKLKTSVLIVLLLAAWAAPVWAGEEKPPLQVVEDLAEIIKDEDAKWIDKWNAYKAAKDAIDAEKAAIEDEDQRVAAKRYSEIQEDVADGIRRDTLPVSGWLMGFFGASLLWGGFAVCIAIAIRAGKKVAPDAE